MRKYLLIGFLMLAALAVFFGCDDRGTGVPTGSLQTWGLFPNSNHSFDTLLSLQLKNPKELLLGTTYIPRAAMPAPTGEGRPVPVLVLLAPEGGDQYYYWEHGLFRLVEQMIASGEIEPMVIHCVTNDPVFGTYWYGNSAPAGKYDGIIGSRLLTEYLGTRIPATVITDQRKRGIGGVGTGAYGAFRAALKHPGAFGSISVTDGPLDFDGTNGTGGLVPLFAQSLSEQGLLNASNAEFKAEFDSSQAYPLSRIFIGGSLAFSPHDTSISFIRVVPNFPNDTGATITIADSAMITDENTLITNVVKPDQRDLDFHLPFDQYGNPDPIIWPMWMKNNLDTLYNANTDPLANTHLFVASSPSAPYNYYPMTQSWLTTLRSTYGLTVEEHSYDGYVGGPAGSNPYLYDVLKKMLKFHSDRFKAADAAE